MYVMLVFLPVSHSSVRALMFIAFRMQAEDNTVLILIYMRGSMLGESSIVSPANTWPFVDDSLPTRRDIFIKSAKTCNYNNLMKSHGS